MKFPKVGFTLSGIWFFGMYIMLNTSGRMNWNPNYIYWLWFTAIFCGFEMILELIRFLVPYFKEKQEES